MYFKTLFKIFRKQGSRSSVASYARADMQTKDPRSSVTFPARAGRPKLEKLEKYNMSGQATLNAFLHFASGALLLDPAVALPRTGQGGAAPWTPAS